MKVNWKKIGILAAAFFLILSFVVALVGVFCLAVVLVRFVFCGNAASATTGAPKTIVQTRVFKERVEHIERVVEVMAPTSAQQQPPTQPVLPTQILVQQQQQQLTPVNDDRPVASWAAPEYIFGRSRYYSGAGGCSVPYGMPQNNWDINVGIYGDHIGGNVHYNNFVGGSRNGGGRRHHYRSGSPRHYYNRWTSSVRHHRNRVGR